MQKWIGRTVLAFAPLLQGCDKGPGPGPGDDGTSQTDAETDTESDATSTSTGSSDSCSVTDSVPPYDPGNLPDTDGWEASSMSGIYLQSGGGYEGFPAMLSPCDRPTEDWCVYWAVRPPSVDCFANLTVRGRLSGLLSTDELCNTVVGTGPFDRAIVIESVETVSPCDDTACQPGRGHCGAPFSTCSFASDDCG